MAVHLYITPMIGAGTSQDPRRSKYIPRNVVEGVFYFGQQPVAIFAADVDDATDAALQANSDVRRIPDDLDATLGAGAVTVVQNFLETFHIPAGWVTQGLTYRFVLRTICGFFSFLQRYAVIANNPNPVLGGAVTLSTQFNQLPAAARQNLRDAAASFSLDISGLSPTSTMRAILTEFANQWGQRSFSIGSIAI